MKTEIGTIKASQNKIEERIDGVIERLKITQNTGEEKEELMNEKWDMLKEK